MRRATFWTWSRIRWQLSQRAKSTFSVESGKKYKKGFYKQKLINFAGSSISSNTLLVAVLTFPADLMPLKTQTKTRIQASTKQPKISHCMLPMSLMDLVLPSTTRLNNVDIKNSNGFKISKTIYFTEKMDLFSRSMSDIFQITKPRRQNNTNKRRTNIFIMRSDNFWYDTWRQRIKLHFFLFCSYKINFLFLCPFRSECTCVNNFADFLLFV